RAGGCGSSEVCPPVDRRRRWRLHLVDAVIRMKDVAAIDAFSRARDLQPAAIDRARISIAHPAAVVDQRIVCARDRTVATFGTATCWERCECYTQSDCKNDLRKNSIDSHQNRASCSDVRAGAMPRSRAKYSREDGAAGRGTCPAFVPDLVPAGSGLLRDR